MPAGSARPRPTLPAAPHSLASSPRATSAKSWRCLEDREDPNTTDPQGDAVSTATVQTLTAEVRTLVVGSRQITMSVAKQLDVVPLTQLQVFGRVKLPSGDCWVIGSDPDGVLAVAKYLSAWAIGKIEQFKTLSNDAQNSYEAERQMDRVGIYADSRTWINDLIESGEASAMGIARSEAAAATPLIVLAGLR